MSLTSNPAHPSSYLLLQGGNQGRNQISEFPPANPDENRGSGNSEVWLTVAEGGNLLGVTDRAVKKSCKAGKYTVKMVPGNGGNQYRILLTSLPPEAQARYWSARMGAEPARMEPETAELNARLLAETPDYNRRKAEKYLSLFHAAAGLRGQALRRFLDEWNEQNPDCTTSYQSYMREKKRYEQGGFAALLGQYGKTVGRSKIPDHLFEHFKSLYLREGGPSEQYCWLSTMGMARRIDTSLDPNSFPSVSTFMRRLKAEVPEDGIYIARHGMAAWNRKYHNYIDRDYSGLRAGTCWVGDHHQADVACHEGGKYFFPWLTAWVDFKTQKFLGWQWHREAPNSDHIFQSFHNAASEYGLPSDLYMDNGKDYRCKDFAGGRKYHRLQIDERKTVAMVSALGIEPHFALPYNAQAKVIERCFLRFKDWMARGCPGYRGGNVTERPEKLAQEISSGVILEFNEFVRLADFFIREVDSAATVEGKVLRGESKDEAFFREVNACPLPAVTPDALKLFCSRTSGARVIGRNGVRDSELDVQYWGEWMSGMKGEQVYLRRDINRYQEAWVFRASDDEFLGKALIAQWQAPALAKTDAERSQLRDVMSRKRRSEKIVRQYAQAAQAPAPEEALHNLAAGVRAQASARGAQPAGPTGSNVVRMTPMDEVIAQEKEQSRTGTYDLSAIMPPEKPRRKIHLFESDKDGGAE